MDKNLLRAQLLMEAADLLNEEYDDYEELYESSRKPNTNERYALAKGYVDEDGLEVRDNAKRHGKEPRKYAPGVAYAKYEMENNRYNYRIPTDNKVRNHACDILNKRWKDYEEYPHNDDTKKALYDRHNAAFKIFKNIHKTTKTNMGWAHEYDDPVRGKYRRPEDLPDEQWKKTVRSEGKDPWRQYPGKK